MADPLSTAEAKAALSDLGRPHRVPQPTTRDAKENLRRLSRGPTLLCLARTTPFLALPIAFGYGLILGRGRRAPGKFIELLEFILTKLLPGRAGNPGR